MLDHAMEWKLSTCSKEMCMGETNDNACNESRVL